MSATEQQFVVTDFEKIVLGFLEDTNGATPKFLAEKAWPETFKSPRVGVRAALWQKMGAVLRRMKRGGLCIDVKGRWYGKWMQSKNYAKPTTPESPHE